MEKQIRNIPMVALRGMTIMPEMVVHFDVSRAYSIQAIQQVMQGERTTGISCCAKRAEYRRSRLKGCI